MHALADDAIGVTADAPPKQFPPEFSPTIALWQRCAVAMLAVPLLALSFAPFNQFYLAWIGLVPWLVAVTRCRSAKSAALTGYIGGFAFFALNFWWLWHATFLGTLALLLYLSSWWALAGAVIFRLHRWGRHSCLPRHSMPAEFENREERDGRQECLPHRLILLLLLIPAAWTAAEWLRGGAGGMFPWFALSQSQIPLLPMCQIAEITGHWGVTFWVMMCNTLILIAWQLRRNIKRVVPPACGFALITLGILSYGYWRIHQTQPTPGPTLLVIQPNFPHARGGARTVTQEQQIEFHFRKTDEALNALRKQDVKPELIVWSETVMPPLNPEVRAGAGGAAFLNKVHADLEQLVRLHETSLLLGAYAVPTVQPKGAPAAEADIRNAAYFYTVRAPQQRYDKMRLVPFGEYVWFKETIPWLHAWLFKMAAYAVDYVITPGASAQQIVFTLPRRSEQGGDRAGGEVKFVTPICMEDMDSGYVASMFRGPGGKRAQLLVNITNDGWFNAYEKAQHLQAATFRSIENRVWTARANNTGMSGFIDSTGKVVEMLGADREGWAMQRVGLDERLTFYTRFGDVFAMICAVGSVIGLVVAWRRA